MAENNKFLTESFELVVDDFYNAVEAANPTEKSTSSTLEIETIARAIIDRFDNAVSLTESGEEKEVVSSMTIEPIIASVDETGLSDVTERESSSDTVVVVESPESPPPGTLLHQSPNLSPIAEDYQVTDQLKLKRAFLPEVYAKDVLETDHHDNRDTISHLYLRTRNSSHLIDFEWALENFSQYMEMTQSSKFSAENCEKIWQISIVSKIQQHSEFLELHTEAMFVFKGTICVNFDLGLYSKRGDCFQIGVATAVFTENRRQHKLLLAKDPFARSTGDDVETGRDEIIIKGRIILMGCCIKTERFNEPKLRTM